jgi:ribosome-binding protein aMBF1 (putative translation factor)
MKAENYSSKLLIEILSEIPQEEQEKTDKMMRLASIIDNGIKARGWKKSDLAKALNKRPSEISRWLSGTHNFSSNTLRDIDKILNIGFDATFWSSPTSSSENPKTIKRKKIRHRKPVAHLMVN